MSNNYMSIEQSRSLKLKQLLYALGSVIFLIIVRLFYLQIDQGAVFSSLGEGNCLRTEIIPPLRGNLLDCNNVLLAANRPVFNLYWQGGSTGKFNDQSLELLKKLEIILNVSLVNETMIKDLKYAERYTRRVLLEEDLSFEQLCKISEQCSDVSSLVVENHFKRIYPHQAIASHVLGFLSRVEKIGRAGLESAVQAELQGQTGYVVQKINATGKMLEEKISKEAIAGSNITLTLDLRLQALAESLFEKDQSGVCIVMDPETGAIKTLVSYPNFDPNIFLEPISEEAWKSKMVVNNPLLNRATCALYPPASIFKLITFTAGLEEKLIDHDTLIRCDGHITFCGRKYHCMRRTGHGDLFPTGALAASCNIPCFNIGKRIKIDKLAEYAYRFGLGQKTNFLLPEHSGLVPTTAWKLSARGERWWTGDTLSTCIGQGPLLVTPLQIVRMISSIESGYLVKPRILEHETIEREKLDISKETLRFLRNSMKEAVNSGTVMLLSFIRGFEVCAKTGTAQTCSLSLDKEKLQRKHLEHAWLSGWFSYKGSKPLAIMIVVENVGSSSIALRFADRFLRGYRALQEADKQVLASTEIKS